MVANGRIPAAVLVVTLAVSSWSQPVAAQAVALSPATHPELRVGRRVWVTLADGPVIEGRITSVSDTELGILSGQRVRPLPWRAVRLVETKDSLGNGLLLGALIGAGGGALGGALTHYSLCGGGQSCNDDAFGEAMVGSVMAGLIVAVPISLLIDHAHTGRQTIYRSAAQISLGPLMVPGRFGVGGVVRW